MRDFERRTLILVSQRSKIELDSFYDRHGNIYIIIYRIESKNTSHRFYQSWNDWKVQSGMAVNSKTVRITSKQHGILAISDFEAVLLWRKKNNLSDLGSLLRIRLFRLFQLLRARNINADYLKWQSADDVTLCQWRFKFKFLVFTTDMAINVSNQKIPHLNLDLTVHSVKFKTIGIRTTAVRKKVQLFY